MLLFTLNLNSSNFKSFLIVENILLFCRFKCLRIITGVFFGTLTILSVERDWLIGSWKKYGYVKSLRLQTMETFWSEQLPWAFVELKSGDNIRTPQTYHVRSLRFLQGLRSLLIGRAGWRRDGVGPSLPPGGVLLRVGGGLSVSIIGRSGILTATVTVYSGLESLLFIEKCQVCPNVIVCRIQLNKDNYDIIFILFG